MKILRFHKKHGPLREHTMDKRHMKRGYRRMARINLFEAENGGGADIADYEKWLTEKEIK